MANSRSHLLAGGAISLSGMMFLKWLRNEKLTFWDGVGAALVGCFGACLPDLLEPPDNPSHRKVLHSMAIGGAGIPFTISKTYKGDWSFASTNGDRDFIIILSLGYLSHLVLDAGTPRGLPIL